MIIVSIGLKIAHAPAKGIYANYELMSTVAGELTYFASVSRDVFRESPKVCDVAHCSI